MLSGAYSPASAHERWILTPDQIRTLNQTPKPEIYTTPTIAGLLILLLFGSILAFLVYAHYFRSSSPWLIALSGRMRRKLNWVPTILRLFLGWTLVVSALGLVPRLGNATMTYPTFLAPDLEMMPLDPAWHWLIQAELLCGILFILGLWPRITSALFLIVLHLGLWLFGEPLLAYYPTYLGVVVFIAIRGSGALSLRGPIWQPLSSIPKYLDNIPPRYPQFLLRIFAGLNFLYLGIWFKVLQPNLVLEIIKVYEVPVLHYQPEIFTFFMACVEVTIGIVITAGILIRPASIALFIAFFFFATFLPEGYDAHLLFYGVLLAFLLGGPGRLSQKGVYQKRIEDETYPPRKRSFTKPTPA
jgi:uncharacterized membrane protein YphA (DoxX/SURF4 family)